MGSVHPEEHTAARWSAGPGNGQSSLTPPPDGPDSGEVWSEAEALSPFAHASLADDAFFGAAFDEDVGAEGPSAPQLHRPNDGCSAADNEAMAATFGEVAAIYLRPLQHFCVELCRGPVAAGRIAPLLPPLGTVIESARGMGLEQVAERFSSLQGYFDAIQQSGALSVEGTSREAVLRVSESLAEALPGAFGTCATGDPLDGVMLRTVLQLVPAVTTHSLEQFFGAGFTSVEMLAGADPAEVTAITGLAPHLCETCVRHAGGYLAERGQRLHLASPADWLPVLEPRLGELERLQRAIDGGKVDTDDERRRLRRERQRAVLFMELLLAEMGRVALLEELQRQRLERRLEKLREFVVELRRPSREELVRRLGDGQSLQHLDLRDQHLEGIHLPRADLAGSDLTGANLAGADLRGARFIHACLRESFLQGIDLDGAKLRHSHLEGADLSHARMAGADLSRASLEAARLEGANLEGTCLRRVRATDASFAKARLMGADLRGADLSGVDAGGADLRGADLGDAIVAGANFRRADLRGAQLTGCDLTTARLEGARLEGDGTWKEEPAESVAPVGGGEHGEAAAAASQSSVAVSEAVFVAVRELGPETVPGAVETGRPVPHVAPSADVDSASFDDPEAEYEPSVEAALSLLVETAAATPPHQPLPVPVVEPSVVVTERPGLRPTSPVGRRAWAAAAGLVVVVGVAWFQTIRDTPEVAATAQLAPTTPAESGPVAALTVQPAAPEAVEPGPPVAQEPVVAEAATEIVPAPEPAAAAARPAPKDPNPDKKVPTETAAAAPVQPVSPAPARVAKERPTKIAAPTKVPAAKGAGVKTAKTSPAVKAKTSPTKPAKAPSAEVIRKPAAVEAAPVQLAKAAPTGSAETTPARKAKKAAPVKREAVPPPAPQPAVKAIPKAAPELVAAVAPAPAPVPVVQATAGAGHGAEPAQERVRAVEIPSVAFADASLEACVRKALEQPIGPLSTVDVAGLTALNCATPEAGRTGVTRLEGIEALVGLVALDLSSNQITDIGPLAGLKRLEKLNLRSNRIADIGPVSTLPSACEIDLWQNPIGDITPLLLRSKR